METPWVGECWKYLFETYPEWLVAGLGTFLVHECCYFAVYLPWLLADFMPSLHKYKIQPLKENTWALQWRCLKKLFFLHFVIEFPMVLLAHHFFRATGMSTDYKLIPSWWTLAWQMVAFLVAEDFYFYWIHRLLHYGPFYKYIHKVHHHHAAPFGIAAEYAHPVETVFLGVGTVLGPVMFGTHLFTVWVWLVVRVFQTVEVHSGYNFPWSLNNLIPFWGGAEFHDFHHMAFTGNYSSTFTWWDKIFGTDAAYNAWKHPQKQPENKKDASVDKKSQ